VERERQAAIRAASVLGCSQPTFLDLQDERLGERLLDAIVPLEACVERVQPEVVYTTHGGDTNQDHRAMYEATLEACRSFARPSMRRLLCYEVPSSTDQSPPLAGWAFLPSLYVDISSFLATKLEAARAYETESRPFPHPRSPEAVRALATYRGTQAGFAAAEAFVVIRDTWA
jgi:LmbE family N-acetylglucosaminyl deacetylase